MPLIIIGTAILLLVLGTITTPLIAIAVLGCILVGVGIWMT